MKPLQVNLDFFLIRASRGPFRLKHKTQDILDFKKMFIIYFGFFAAHAFSNYCECGVLSCCRAKASLCSDFSCCGTWTSLVAQMVKHLPTTRETHVQSLGWEDPLEKKWQPTPVLLPGKSHGWRNLVGYSPRGHKESDTSG